MLKTTSLLLSVAVGTALAQSAASGGYYDVPVGANETALLAKALATDSLYGASVASRLCFSAIESLQQQTVAGVNYRFTVTGCEVQTAQEGQGKCPSAVLASCAPKTYVVTVFDQPWTNTTEVSSIKTTTEDSESSHESGAGDHKGSLGDDSDGSEAGSNVQSKSPTTGVPSPAPTPTSAGHTTIAPAVFTVLALGVMILN